MREDTSADQDANSQALCPHSHLNNFLRYCLMSARTRVFVLETWKNRQRGEVTNLSLEIMPPATAIDRTQLPRIMLYWCRVAQSPIFSFVVRAFHRASSSAASLSNSHLPAPVLKGVRRKYSVQELGLTSVHDRIPGRAFQPGWISRAR